MTNLCTARLTEQTELTEAVENEASVAGHSYVQDEGPTIGRTFPLPYDAPMVDTDDEEPEPQQKEDEGPLREPTPQEKREILKIHRGLNHPETADFVRALKHAGARQHLISGAARSMRCPTCSSRRWPKARRMGALPRCMRFNQTIGCDVITLSAFGRQYRYLNIVCWGTGFQMLGAIQTASAAETLRALLRVWVRPFGWPEIIITDQGPEFTSHEWHRPLAEQGVISYPIDSKSP